MATESKSIDFFSKSVRELISRFPNSLLVPFEAFERLLEDDVFCDYFNKFCSLPLFGQRVVYVRSEQSFFLDPEMKDNLSKEQIAKVKTHNQSKIKV